MYLLSNRSVVKKLLSEAEKREQDLHQCLEKNFPMVAVHSMFTVLAMVVGKMGIKMGKVDVKCDRVT
jgi:hypothetical protein